MDFASILRNFCLEYEYLYCDYSQKRYMTMPSSRGPSPPAAALSGSRGLDTLLRKWDMISQKLSHFRMDSAMLCW